MEKMTILQTVRENPVAEEEKNYERPHGRALVFAWLLPELQAVAKSCGYAIGVHGSMRRDLDLIAAPWTEEATDPKDLIDALVKTLGGTLSDKWMCGAPTVKPYGRLCWCIYFDANQEGWGPYLDISVMPKANVSEHEDTI